MNSVNKTELAHRIAERSGLPFAEAYTMLNCAIKEIKLAVAGGDRVTITGFGTMERIARAPRMARNPKTSEQVPVPAKTVPVFRASKAFINEVNEAAGK